MSFSDVVEHMLDRVIALAVITRLGLSQQTERVDPLLAWCWAIVCDAGPASSEHLVNILCLLGAGRHG